jgi:hypothetical protein
MKRPETRHYTEEELLMHLLQEESPEMAEEIAGHLPDCGECSAVLAEYKALLVSFQDWTVPEVSEIEWQRNKAQLLGMFRQDRERFRQKAPWFRLQQTLGRLWDYALENPLPTMAFVAAATAFALERTITVFRLDRLLPVTGELIEILRQAL